MLRPLAPAQAPGATGILELWAAVPVSQRVALDDLRALPPGDARREAVVQRMRAATSAGSDALVGELGRSLASAGATVELREQLWLDASAVLRVSVPSGAGDAAVEQARRALAGAGARMIDPSRLPRAILQGSTGGEHHLHAIAARRAVVDHGRAAAPVMGPQWFAQRDGYELARAAGLDGRGVRVAVVDSGVDPRHPELAAALGRGGAFNPWGDVPITSGHGTFVAGILAGRQTGLAPGVDLISTRTYGASFGDHRGERDEVRIAQRVNATRALQEALAPADGRRGADLLVTSWGILDAPGEPRRDYDRAMATIAAAGAVVVAAAGNDGGAPDGRGTIAVPAQLEDVIAVGGVGRTDRWHPRASAGPSPRTTLPKPDIAAPVVDVRSTSLSGELVDTTGQDGDGFAGTSAAAPMVAAAFALVTQALHERDGASPDIDEIRRVLPLLTRDVESPGPDAWTGHGVVRVDAARAAADAILQARTAQPV